MLELLETLEDCPETLVLEEAGEILGLPARKLHTEEN
jgi:hypothetical protein